MTHFFRAQEADVVILLLDPKSLDDLDTHYDFIDKKKLIVLHGKGDLFEGAYKTEIRKKYADFISTITGEGIENLKAKIVDIALRK